MGLEGVIAQARATRRTSPARTETWLKLKCRQRQEFVIVRLHRPRRRRTARSAACCSATTTSGELQLRRQRRHRLERADRARPARAAGASSRSTSRRSTPRRVKPGRWSRRTAGGERWVKPSWSPRSRSPTGRPTATCATPCSRACAPTSRRSEITRERPARRPRRRRRPPAAGAARRRAGSDQGHQPRARHRPVDRPHQARPGALLRERRRADAAAPEGPAGVAGARARAASPASCSSRSTPRRSMPGLTRARPGALARPRGAARGRQRRGAGRGGADERRSSSTPGTRPRKRIDKPDRVVFDLDPGEGVTWAHVQEAALLMRALLEELGLQSWLKTSGGKGLHVVVPLAPQARTTTR